MVNKERGHCLVGFIALCQSRSSSVLQTYGASTGRPASVLAPKSALGSLPSVALSSAQANAILSAPTNGITAKIGYALARPPRRSRPISEPEAKFSLVNDKILRNRPKLPLASPSCKGVKTCVLRAISVGRF